MGSRLKIPTMKGSNNDYAYSVSSAVWLLETENVAASDMA